MNWMNAEEMLRRAETPLFWVGAFAVASLALWLLYRLLSGFRIWVLGNGELLSPKLGKWAGELGHINFYYMALSSEAGRWDSTCEQQNEVIGLKLHFERSRAGLIQGEVAVA